MTEPAIRVHDLAKSYGDTSVLAHLDLEVAAGSITAVLGASGQGKTTLLRVLAGFEPADRGSVDIGGRVVDDGRRSVRPQHRGIGYVPQDASLFPHLTVAGNIGFGLKHRDRGRVADLVALVGLAGFEHRHPHELSGGQQQRVALARALAIRPQIVLLDEPFASLDSGLRETVRSEVMQILVGTGATAVLVTHDQDEALSVADHVALLDGGRVVAHDTPRGLYERPPTPDVARLVGDANLLAGRVIQGRARCELGDLDIAAPVTVADGTACTVLLRPEQITVVRASSMAHQVATVRRVDFHGHDAVLRVRLAARTQAAEGSDGVAAADGASGELSIRVGAADAVRAGDAVSLSADQPCHVWAR